MHKRRKPIHIWASGMRDDTGGIQAFSLYFTRAVAESFPEHPLRVLVKNERPVADEAVFEQARVKLRCFDIITPALRTPVMAAAGVLAATLERPCCILSTHMHFLPAMHLAWPMCGARYAAVLHGIEAWGGISFMRRHALGEADQIFAVSHFTRDRVIREHGLESARVSVLPNTFDPSRFAIGPKPEYLLKRHGLRADQTVILTVSRLSVSERYKGHEQLIRALPAILQRFPDLRYIIGGEGPYRQELVGLTQELGLSERVIFAGYVPREELADYYRLCDVFAMPSTKEGFGIVFMEAMASGKPSIAGDQDGSVDALAGGRLGALVNPTSVEEIAQAAIQLLGRTHPNALLADPAGLRAGVIAEFGWEAFCANVKRLISPLVQC